VQTDKTSESLREFFNELREIRDPVASDELTKAKNYVALGFPGSFETIGDLSSQLEQLVVHGLPDDYYAAFVKNIQAVSAAEVQKAAATYIQPDRFLVVVVGDRKVIEPGIQKLGLGPVRVFPVEEAVGR
jgi:zinc protease